MSPPVIFQNGMSMEDLRGQVPGLTDDQIRAELIYKSLEYRLADDFTECGMLVRLGAPWPDFGHCLLEVTQEDLRVRYGFKRFYVYNGPGLDASPEAVGFDEERAALNYLRAEQNS